MSSLPLLVLLGVIGPWQVVIIVALILVLFAGADARHGPGYQGVQGRRQQRLYGRNAGQVERDDQTDRRDDQIVPLARFPSGVPSGLGRVCLIARIYDR